MSERVICPSCGFSEDENRATHWERLHLMLSRETDEHARLRRPAKRVVDAFHGSPREISPELAQALLELSRCFDEEITTLDLDVEAAAMADAFGEDGTGP